MNLEEKLKILADSAKYDASCSSSGSKRKTEKSHRGKRRHRLWAGQELHRG